MMFGRSPALRTGMLKGMPSPACGKTPAKAAFPVDAEGPSRRGSGTKYGVDVRDDEDLAFSSTVKHGEQVVRQFRSFGGLGPDLGAERCQARCEQGFDLGAARDVPGAGIDVDDFFEKLESTRAGVRRRPIDLIVPMRGGRRACATNQCEYRRNHTHRPYRPHCPSLLPDVPRNVSTRRGGYSLFWKPLG